MSDAPPKALAALAFTILVWGVTFVFVRAFSLAAGPYDALIIRLVSAALLFAVILAVGPGFSIARRDLGKLVLVSLTGMLGYFVGTVFGFAHAPAGLGAIVMATQPILIALLAAAAGAERLTPFTIAGLTISFAGTALLLWNGSLSPAQLAKSQLAQGLLMIFLAGVAWAIFVVFSRRLIETYGALKITGLASLIVAAPVLPFIDRETVTVLTSLDRDGVLSLLFLTFLGATASLVAWNYAAGKLAPSLLGASLYLVTPLSVAAGWLMLGEQVTWQIVLGAAVIMTGVAISQLRAPASMAKILPLLAVLFAVTMWGLVPVGMRFLLIDLTAQQAMLLRLVPAGLMAAAAAVIVGVRSIDSRDWAKIVIAALCGNVAYQVLAAFGMETVPASWTGMIFGLEPVFIALFAATFAGDRITGWLVGGLLLAILGTATLMFGSTMPSSDDVTPWGIVLVTFATMGWGVYTVVIRPVAAKYGAFPVACLALAISALPMFALVRPDTPRLLVEMTVMQWATVAFLAIFATILSTSAWNYALGHMNSSIAGMFLYIQPLVAAIGGFLLLGESLSWPLAAGGALIVAGVALAQFGPLIRSRGMRRKHGTAQGSPL
jgi:drug/metabolite transporter (DMT)-like permease